MLRRGLIAAAATFVVAGVLAAAVIAGGDPKTEDTAIEASASTTSSVAGATDGSAAPEGGGTEPAAGDGTATTAAAGQSPTTAAGTKQPTGTASTTPPTTAAGQAPAPSGFADLGPAESGGAVSVPKAGTYKYAFKGRDRQGEGTTTVEDEGAGAAGARKLVMTIAGQGFDSRNDVTWGPAEVRVTKSRLSFNGRQADCDWEPDHLEMKIALAKDAAWDSSSSCTISGLSPTPIVIKRTTTAKVAEARRVRVAGQEIDVWVITGTESFDAAGRGQQATTTTWFSAAHGMVVRSVSQTAEGEVSLEILNLDPA